MKRWIFSIRTRIIALNVIGMILMLGVAHYCFNQFSGTMERYDTLMSQDVQFALEADRINLQFQRQMKAWKDLLIRSEDKSDVRKYWVDFRTEEQNTNDLTVALLEKLPEGESRKKVEEFQQQHLEMGEAFRSGFSAFMRSKFDAQQGDEAVIGLDDAPTLLIEELVAEIAEDAKNKAGDIKTETSKLLNTAKNIMLAATIAVTFIFLMLVIPIARGLRSAVKITQSIAHGRYNNSIKYNSHDELDDLMQGLDLMQSQLQAQIEREREVAAENMQIRQALDQASSAMMALDGDMRIIYINHTTTALFTRLESELRSLNPVFNIDSIIGMRLSEFDTQLSENQQLSNGSRTVYWQDKTLEYTVDLIRGETTEIEGAVVQWTDQTEILLNKKREAKKLEREKEAAEENARLSSALNTCMANVMMVDNEGTIRYLNGSAKQMFDEGATAFYQNGLHTDISSLEGEALRALLGPNHSSLVEDFLSLEKSPKNNINICERTYEIVSTAVFDQEGKRIGSVIEWQDLTESLAQQEREMQTANENKRVRQALDNSSTCTMIIGSNGDIIYKNEHLQALFGGIADQISDVWSRESDEATHWLENHSEPFEKEIHVGAHTLLLTAAHVVDEDNNTIGCVVEWRDRSTEISIENEIDLIIDAAARGDLSKRVSEKDKHGFFAQLSSGLNSLLDNNQEAINDIKNVFSGLAQGNLSQKIDKAYEGDFGELKDYANNTIDILTDAIRSIQQASSEVLNGITEIAHSNSDLSARSEAQRASLEETSNNMENITTIVRQATENATRANQLSDEARQNAEDGQGVSESAIEAMDLITQSSVKIESILGVIDEIAFQTNLLALNAAVEAARAGESGRGFAVVAAEVRNLAQRSSASSNEIKLLIKDSVEKIKSGSELVHDSGEKLKAIVDSVENVSTMMDQILASAKEQTSGIADVNDAVEAMKGNVAQYMVQVANAKQSSQSMVKETENVTEKVSFFTLPQVKH